MSRFPTQAKTRSVRNCVFDRAELTYWTENPCRSTRWERGYFRKIRDELETSPFFAPSRGKLLQILSGPEMFCKISMFAMSSLTFMALVRLSWVRLSDQCTADTEQPRTGANHSEHILRSLCNHLGFLYAFVSALQTEQHTFIHRCIWWGTSFVKPRCQKLFGKVNKQKKNSNIPRSYLHVCLIGTQDHGMSISRDHFLMTFDWLSGISWVKLALLQKQRVSELKMGGNISFVLHM